MRQINAMCADVQVFCLGFVTANWMLGLGSDFAVPALVFIFTSWIWNKAVGSRGLA